MSHTNSVQIMQGDINYILRDEIPLFTVPFIDDVAMKGPVTHYENADGTYENIPENSGIRRFVWEHLTNVHRILQWLKYVGGTFSGKKLELCIPTIVILGQRCNYEGRVPHEAKTQKIQDWPIPIDVTGVRGFLGTCGLVRIFIKDFAKHACPLVNLTRKDITFHFGAEEIAAMENIKDLVTHSPALRLLNYAAQLRRSRLAHHPRRRFLRHRHRVCSNTDQRLQASVSEPIWIHSMDGTRVSVLPGQTQAIWSIPRPPCLPHLHHWREKSCCRGRC
jgi:hypothetical protein